jgi:hypothetical protein
MQAIRHGTMLPSRQRTRSGTSELDPFTGETTGQVLSCETVTPASMFPGFPVNQTECFHFSLPVISESRCTLPLSAIKSVALELQSDKMAAGSSTSPKEQYSRISHLRRSAWAVTRATFDMIGSHNGLTGRGGDLFIIDHRRPPSRPSRGLIEVGVACLGRCDLGSLIAPGFPSIA